MSFLKRLVDFLSPLGFLLAVGVLAWTKAQDLYDRFHSDTHGWE